MSYIGNSPGVASQRVVTTITATAGQTQFTTLSGYVLGYVDVYLNGAKLVNGTDFEAITGTYITLFAAAVVDDVVELISYVPRGLTDGYTKAEADAKFLDVTGDTATGPLIINGITVGKGGGAVSTNTAVGASALAANTTGDRNAAFGNNALFSNQGGQYNVGLGDRTAYSNTSGSNLIAIGSAALYSNTTGANNVAIGRSALESNTTASSNTAVGYQAGYSNTTSPDNAYFGYQAGYSATTNGGNTGIGNLSLKNNTGYQNTAVGSQSMLSNTSGVNNTALGKDALQANTTASNNVAVGYQALRANTTGSGVTAVGTNSLLANTTGADSSAFGIAALAANTTGNYNTALGREALQANTTASSNTAVGYQAGYTNSTGAGNTFLGYYSGQAATTGSYNTAVGMYSANAALTGNQNTFVGYASGSAITSGAKNTIIGGFSGYTAGFLDIRTLSNWIVLSDGDGNPRFYSDGSGNLYAGTSNISFSINSTGGYSRFGSINATNVLQVAYNSTTSGVSLTSAATSWGTFSDQRLKNVTGVYENALSDIAQIEPIKFTWKSDESNKPCVGVLAHTVKAVVPEAVEEVANSMEDETLYLQVRYTELIPLMIASIKELKAEVDSLKSQLNQGA